MDPPFVPPGYEGMQTYWNRIQNRYKYKSKGRDIELERIIKAYYYACISLIDFNIGRIIHKLKQEDIYDETLVIFTSDHGEMLGDFNCYGKRGFLDGAARIPLIVRNPGVAEGEKIDEPVSLVDIAPTIMEYAGLEKSEAYDGQDLFEEEFERPVAGQYHEYDKALYMLVEENLKYIFSAPDSKEWLFDNAADPLECHNRAEDLIYGEMTTGMRKKMVSIIKKSKYKDAVYKDRFVKYRPPDDYKTEDEGLLFQDAEGSIPEIEGYTDRKQGGNK
jgi:arylsulfatase A-like enzyme